MIFMVVRGQRIVLATGEIDELWAYGDGQFWCESERVKALSLSEPIHMQKML